MNKKQVKCAAKVGKGFWSSSGIPELTAAAFMIVAAPAFAGTVSLSGTAAPAGSTTDVPNIAAQGVQNTTFNTCNIGPFDYAVMPFTVDQSGIYTATSTTPTIENTTFFLAGTFSPSATPCPFSAYSRFLVSVYSGTTAPHTSTFTGAGLNLVAGLQYSVLIAFNHNGTGSEPFTLNMSGPGCIAIGSNTCAPLPSPPPKISYSAPRAVSENGTTSTVTFSLSAGAPTADVVLPIVSSNTNEVTVSPAAITFTPGGPIFQTVTFTGVDDQVIDGDQAVLIQVGPAQSSDSNYAGYSPGNFTIVNRDNDVALPALPYAGGALIGFVDINNPGNSAISVAARAYDKNGVLNGSGMIVQDLPAKGGVSIDMATLQAALGITGVSANDDARIELLPVGGDIMAQGRIRFNGDSINASAANRVGAANLPGSANADRFTLRITNLNPTAQDARATLYSDSGVLLSNPGALLASQLAPRASLDLDVNTLQAALGIGPWTGRAQLMMDKNSNFAVQMMDVSSGMRTMNPLLDNGSGGGLAINYILPPGDATGDTFVRIYNQEGFAVNFAGSLYSSSGNLLGSVALGTATAHSELLFGGNQLQSLFGNVSWSGPARLVISSDMTSFQAQSLVRRGNVLADVSNVINDGIVANLPDAA